MILPVRPRDVLRDKGYFGYCACGEPMRFSIDTPARERVWDEMAADAVIALLRPDLAPKGGGA